VQLTAEVELLRTIDRAVFTPPPRVDSALVRLTRTGPAPDPPVRDLIRAGFAHRRKSLARSLELWTPGYLTLTRAALEGIGLSPDLRAEALSPAQFMDLVEEMQGRR
jgi:16S rRNA (adenine1518-N6/adenine1519-N6)-dimethyltransferase